MDGEDVKIDIFDLAGQPYFYEVTAAAYAAGDCVECLIRTYRLQGF